MQEKENLPCATGITRRVLRNSLLRDFSLIILANGFEICFANKAPSLNNGSGAIVYD